MNRRNNTCSVSFVIILLTMIISTNARARYMWSVSAWGGYFVTTGDWKQHRYAPDVNQFGNMPHFGVDLEHRFNRYWSMGIFTQFNSLNTSQWEQYVEQQGEYIDADAQMLTFGLEIRPHVAVTSVNRTMIELGIGLAFLYGKERYSGYTYDYDFLTKGSIALLGAVEQNWLFDRRFALVGRVGIIYIPKGINYADGYSQNIIGFPLSLGIRYLM